MLEKIRHTIIQYGLVHSGQKILAGVSGGPDSMALLHALKTLCDLNITVAAAHLNHSIRGAEADDDERFVEEVCMDWGIEFIHEKMDVPAMAKLKGWTLEQAAREIRYAFFRQAKENLRADRIAVAHHMEDQAETVLLHLFRGAGLNGLTGMKPISGDIIRPLLFVSKEEVLKYIRKNSIPFRVDRTNQSSDYSRNRIRHELIPYIQKQFNPEFVDACCRMASVLSEDAELLDMLAFEKYIASRLEDGTLVCHQVSALSAPLKSRVLMLALKEKGIYSNIEKQHLDAIASILDAQTGTMFSLPGGFRAWVSYGRLSIGRMLEKKIFELQLNLYGVTPTPLGNIVCTQLDTVPGDLRSFGPFTAHFDLDKLPKQLVVRTRRDGDVFEPLGSGRKKLKEYFIDKKVPREDRNGPLIASDNVIIWITGFEISESAKVTQKTKSVLRMEFISSPAPDIIE